MDKMNNLLTEDIKRIHELMYGTINEAKFTGLRDFLGSMDDIVRNVRGELPSSLATQLKFADELAQLKTLKGEAAINKAKKIEDEIQGVIDNLVKRKDKLTNPDQIAKINDKIKKLEGQKNEVVQSTKTYKASNDAYKAGKNKAKKNTNQQTITPTQTNTQLPSGGTIQHPPINQPNRFMDWLKRGLAAKIAKYVLLFSGGVLTLGFLIRWLLSSEDKNENCMGKLLQDRNDRVKPFRADIKKKGVYYIVTPDNQNVREISERIILEDINGKFKAFNTDGKHIGGWKFNSNCELFLIYGTQEIPLFSSKSGKKQEEKPKPSKYKPCIGTYNIYCYSESIKKLQGCLGLVQDGYWGRKTEAAVVAKTGKRALTDNEINQICSGVTPPTPNPQPTPPQPTPESGDSRTEDF